jgi:hypothetical protein
VRSLRECTRILGLDGYRVGQIEWAAEGARARLRIWLKRRGIRGYECSGCGPYDVDDAAADQLAFRNEGTRR